LSSLFLAFALPAFAQDSRRFTFHYAFTVKNLPAAKPNVSLAISFADAVTAAAAKKIGGH
jgi:hypothetical protein